MGNFNQDKLHVKLPLFKYNRGKWRKNGAGEWRRTKRPHVIFLVLNRFTGNVIHQVGLSAVTLVEATLKTGRTHQIRVHLQAQSCPIAGDERYGDYQANKRLQKLGLKRMFLHAKRIAASTSTHRWTTPLKQKPPKELQQFLMALEHSA